MRQYIFIWAGWKFVIPKINGLLIWSLHGITDV